MKGRVKWVDIAKGIAVSLVVYGHFGTSEAAKSVIYAFHIPLFFFLSGLFFSFDKFPSYKLFLKKRSVQLLIPYLFFNFITYLLWLFIGRKFGSDISSNIHPLKPILGILYGNASNLPHNVPLWFLTCLFSVENLYFFIFRKTRKQQHFFLLLIIVAIAFINYKLNHVFRLPWGIDIALSMLLFYGLGVNLKSEFLEKNRNKASLSGLLIISFFVVLIIARLNGKIEVSDNYFGNYIYFVLGALAGIIFIVSLSMLIAQVKLKYSLLSFLGRNSLIIFGLHLYAGSFVKTISAFVFHLPLSIYEIPSVSLLLTIFSIVVLLPVVFFINKYLPFVVGKSRK